MFLKARESYQPLPVKKTGLGGTERHTVLRGRRNRREGPCALNSGTEPCKGLARCPQNWRRSGITGSNGGGSVDHDFSLSFLEEELLFILGAINT